jgi:serine-type D-Ala-D-Ala carboxypeptidase (penicillin-binding protein 5/6)
MENKNLLKKFFIGLGVSALVFFSINLFGNQLGNFFYSFNDMANGSFLGANASVSVKSLENKRQEKIWNFEVPEITAKSATAVVLKSKGNKQILYNKNGDAKLSVASLTKLMTALTIFELKETYDFNETITVKQNSLPQNEDQKYKELKIGDKLSVENLLNLMLVESNNDAALALAEPMGMPAFTDVMNFYAEKIGMTSTAFINSTGLDFKKSSNISTANDLTVLAETILEKYPEIFKITTNEEFNTEKIGVVGREIFSVKNTNLLLGKVPNIMGGKTGQTPNSGGCLLLLVKDDVSGDVLVSVVLDSQDRFGDMEKIIKGAGLPI